MIPVLRMDGIDFKSPVVKTVGLYIDFGGWVDILALATTMKLRVSVAELIHLSLSLTAEPTQMVVVLPQSDEIRGAVGMSDRMKSMFDPLEAYVYVFEETTPGVSLLIRATHWHSAPCARRVHRALLRRRTLGSYESEEGPDLRRCSCRRDSCRPDPGGNSGTRNTIVAVPARPGMDTSAPVSGGEPSPTSMWTRLTCDRLIGI